jgi:protein-disulfide isomerase
MLPHCRCQADAHEARIREDFRSGVNGAPSFFINVARYDGVVEVEELLAALTGESG